jgi:DNA modification methylase
MTAPYYADATVQLHHGDCLDVLRDLPDASVDAVVTDPPYGLEFMGKEWDGADGFRRSLNTADVGRDNAFGRTSRTSPEYRAGTLFQQWCELWTAECLRVLKPGGHLLAFGGTRTWHRLACAVEDAGFEVRDSIAWMYGSGFPKSLDVSKAIDKAAGAEREVVGLNPRPGSPTSGGQLRQGASSFEGEQVITAPATDDARTWQGWGTALKPAHEPVVVARKPLAAGTVAANVLAWGTGALNVDGCRVGDDERVNSPSGAPGANNYRLQGGDGRDVENALRYAAASKALPPTTVAGRWPANVVLDEGQAEALDAMSGESASGGRAWKAGDSDTASWRAMEGREGPATRGDYSREGDHGGASRFMYVAKADASERVRVPSVTGTSPNAANRRCAVCKRSEITGTRCECAEPRWERETPGHIAHPTVKPLALMRWLVRLVTPPGGVVLEPFAGSGTTVEACILEGFRCIAIEREADYLPLIEQRIHRRRDPVAAVRGSGEDGGLFDLLGEEPA